MKYEPVLLTLTCCLLEQEIQAELQLFKLLVGSLCPAIYGHELVKAGLLLCLFGGCSKTGGDRVPVRGDPHILVVGDPGLGKSQMLQACSNVAPRGWLLPLFLLLICNISYENRTIVSFPECYVIFFSS